MMDVKIGRPSDRVLTIETSVEVLVNLHEATRRGRRTEAQYKLLEDLGDMIVQGDQEVCEEVARRAMADAPESYTGGEEQADG